MNENNQGAVTGTLHIVPEPPLERAERLLRAFLSIPNGRTRDLAASAVVRVVEHLLTPDEAPAPDRMLVAINASQGAPEENPLISRAVHRTMARVDLSDMIEKARGRSQEAAGGAPPVVETERQEDPVVLVGRSLADVAELNPAPGAARKEANELDEALELARTMAKVDNLRLHHVLDIYRLEGRAAGAQVLSPERVIAWTGTVKRALLAQPQISMWLDEVDDWSAPPLFHDSRGPNAIHDAAKWLLDQWELRS